MHVVDATNLIGFHHRMHAAKSRKYQQLGWCGLRRSETATMTALAFKSRARCRWQHR